MLDTFVNLLLVNMWFQVNKLIEIINRHVILNLYIFVSLKKKIIEKHTIHF